MPPPRHPGPHPSITVARCGPLHPLPAQSHSRERFSFSPRPRSVFSHQPLLPAPHCPSSGLSSLFIHPHPSPDPHTPPLLRPPLDWYLLTPRGSLCPLYLPAPAHSLDFRFFLQPNCLPLLPSPLPVLQSLEPTVLPNSGRDSREQCKKNQSNLGSKQKPGREGGRRVGRTQVGGGLSSPTQFRECLCLLPLLHLALKGPGP